MTEKERRQRLFEIANKLEKLGVSDKIILDLRNWIKNGWVYKPLVK